MSDPMTHIRIERGEIVPGFLAGTPGIGTEVGRASSRRMGEKPGSTWLFGRELGVMAR